MISELCYDEFIAWHLLEKPIETHVFIGRSQLSFW
jgi:hypothetical protein